MIHRWTCLIATLACLALMPDHALAQQGQTGGAFGGGGNQTAGSASTLSAAQGYGLDSRFMGTGFSTFTQGSAALGTTTAGARAGTAGFGQTGGTITGGAAASSGSFGRLGGIGGIGGFGGLGGVGGLGGIGGIYGFGRNMFGNQQQMSNQGNKVIRTRTRLGFSQPLPPSSAVTASFQKVITRVLERGDYGSGTVNVAMEGQVAVLTGTVETSHARDVAERLALLEPGIGEVRNELIVRAAEPTPETSPTRSAGDQPR